jgi:hypothetical protein
VPPAFPAPVEITGQTEPFDVSGIPINCAGTGQDREIQAGIPFPTPRFTDNSSGTVTDKLTGVDLAEECQLFWWPDVAKCPACGQRLGRPKLWPLGRQRGGRL